MIAGLGGRDSCNRDDGWVGEPGDRLVYRESQRNDRNGDDQPDPDHRQMCLLER